MKQTKQLLFRTIIASFLLTIVSTQLLAQREVIVEPGVPGVLNETIKGDTTSTGERVNVNTIYVLRRDASYFITSDIKNNGFKLHIKAEDGNGALPKILAGLRSNGKTSKICQTQDDAIFENLYLNTLKPNDGGVQWGGLRFLGEGKTVVVKGCHILGDKAAAFQIRSANMKFFITDCIIGNMGHPKSFGGNGRLIDTRSNVLDTVVIQNTTFYNLTDRIVRTMGGGINYFMFDHNTGFNIQGRHGTFNMGRSKEIHITNNIIRDPQLQGNCNYFTEEQTQPDTNNFYIVTIDTVLDGMVVDIKNNNFWTTQQVKGYYATLDSVSLTEVLSPLSKQVMGDDAVANAYIEEEVTFTNVPPVQYDYLVQIYTDRNTDSWPENWSLIEPADIDASYGTSATSYTSAENGLPLGDLNWYPEKKAEWVTDVAPLNNILPSEFSIQQNYPNPFNPTTNIEFSIPENGLVSLKVFNVLGQEVAELLDKELATGSYNVSFDASELTSGIYYYTLTSGNFVQTKKMILLK